MPYRNTILALVLLLLAGQSSAQIKVSFDRMPYAPFDEPGYFDDGAESAQSVYGLELGYPILRRGREHNMVLRFQGKLRDIDFQSPGAMGERVDHLYDLRLSLIDVRRIDRRWMLITTVTPGIASDLEQSLGRKDWIFMGNLYIRKQVRRTLSWGVGLAYANYFGQPQILPVLSLNWRDEGKWNLEALLPSKAEVWYAMSSDVKVGLQGRLEGNRYRSHAELGTSLDDPRYRFSTLSLGPLLDFAVKDGASLQLQVAYQARSRFELYDGDDKIATLDREPGAVFRLAFKMGR